ncbi:MAG: nucleotidyl transferase AbiEii/AbiGii toxin family protein [Terriglobales bacterium]
MPELTVAQIADLGALRDHCTALGADLVIIGAIAYQVHFPGELRHTGDIDFAVALDLNEFAELERRLQADGWIRFVNREHRWRSAQGTIMDLLPAGPMLREAKQLTWPVSQFTMSLVGFEHVFMDAQPVEFSPDLTLKVISPTTLMLLKIVAFVDDPQRRVKDLDDIRGLLTLYEGNSERLFSDVVLDAALADFGLAPAFLLGIDLKALCSPEEAAIVNAFLAAMNENNPAWMSFVRARGVGDHVEEDARAQLDAFRKGFEKIPH